MVIYNLNPADNYAFATMIGNFQDGSVVGKDSVRQRLVVPGMIFSGWYLSRYYSMSPVRQSDVAK